MSKSDMQDPKIVQNSDHKAPQITTFDARSIVRKDGVAAISLDGKPYFLRITKANKLIITK